MRKEFSTTKPAILRLSSQTLPATLLGMLLVFSSSANAQQLAGGSITISPSAPTETWDAARDLFPGESTDLQVYVTDEETVNDKEFKLAPNSPTIHLNSPQSIWTTTQGQNGATSFSFEILNAGSNSARHEVRVDATWSTEASPTGGGGSGVTKETILGSATGGAYTEIPVFSWSFDPRLQFADGASLINFTVTGSGSGASISLDNYTIHGASGWTIAANPASQNSISGTVKSSTPSKGKLKIKYNGNDMDENADEIGFAKVDLAIASIGTEANLAEDRQPGGGAAPSPHEMNPGGVVLAPIQGSNSGGKRTKLTLKGNGNSLNEGTYTLTSSGASKLKIFETAEGGDALPQEKHYSASELGESKTLYVGSLPFGPNDQTQTGTITLTYKLPLQIGTNTYEIKDEVKVKLVSLDLDVIHPATGELAEESEDSQSGYVEKGKGGLVAIRRNAETPLTKLVLRSLPNMPTSSKYRLNIDSTLGSGQIKVWKDQACTQLVTSKQTEFDVGVETTLYLAGVDVGIGPDLKIIQEIKINNTWYQGDKVSIAVVHAEIEVVLRCFIPHKWTDAEAPIPTQLLPPAVSSTIAGDRQPYSVEDYDTEPLFRLSQMIVMTPFEELHSQVDISSRRRKKAAPLTEYYEKSEDIPASDQNSDFGETLVSGATPNWVFPPDPNPTSTYTNAHRSGDASKITVSLSGGPGTADFVPDEFTPNIDWEYTISMTRMEYGSNPYIRVKVDGNHNLYPAYEVIVQESDGLFIPVYQVKPIPSVLPGPVSLNTLMEADGSEIDIH